MNWDITGGKNQQREQAVERTLLTLTENQRKTARLEECCDEKTGCRYGNAKCRAGRCVKIGSGGRNRGSRYAYQIWMVWEG